LTPRRGREAGFSLVALMAAMTIMLIFMAAAMPSWKYVVKNEREQELFFRGDQIATAIERYHKKNGGAPPPSLEVLVKGKFLRSAYTDPMVKDGKWKLIRAGEVVTPRAAPGLPGRPVPSPSPSPTPRAGLGSREIVGPFIGVVSTSKDESLRVMNGQDHYDDWLFVAGRPRILGRSGPEPRQGNAAPHSGQTPKPGQPQVGASPGQSR
jgi:type II secretory pathway pseudopilin PulG